MYSCAGHMENHDELTSIAVVFMIFCAMAPLLCVLLFKFYMKSDRTKCDVANSVPSTIMNETVAIERNIPRHISNLRPFNSIKPYVLYSIRPTTKKRTMTALLDTATETRRFSILPKFNGLIRNSISIQIALCQPSHTLLAIIEYFDPATMDREFFDFLQQLFSIIFHPLNIIQTWGDVRNQLSRFVRMGLLSNEQIKRSRFMNVQKQFKTWYNRVFLHQQQCHQRLDYDYTDGRLCSCSHRPCKSSTDRWSLPRAIAYTFDEFLYNRTFGITHCLAITKLAVVIEETWTHEQVKDYIEQQRDNYEEND